MGMKAYPVIDPVATGTNIRRLRMERGLTVREIHHVNKLKNLKGKLPWEVAMIAKRRKTLVVCHNCHVMIHHQ